MHYLGGKALVSGGTLFEGFIALASEIMHSLCQPFLVKPVSNHQASATCSR